MYVLKHTYMNVIHKYRYKNAYISHLCVYHVYTYGHTQIYVSIFLCFRGLKTVFFYMVVYQNDAFPK